MFVQWTILFLILSGITVRLTLVSSREQLAQDRLLLSRTVARYLDASLAQSLRDLERLSSELPSLDRSAAPRMRSVRLQSAFRDGIQLLDANGRVLVSDPEYVSAPSAELLRRIGSTRLLRDGDDQISLVAVHRFNRNGLEYALLARAHPAGSSLSQLLQGLAVERDVGLAVVDSQAQVIAAPDQKQLFRKVEPVELISRRLAANRPLVIERPGCSLCPSPPGSGSRFLTVLVPLEVAPWGVVIQQSRKAAFSVLGPLQVGLVSVTALMVAMGFLLSRSLARTVVAPIRDLSRSAQNLRDGDLDSPIVARGDLEIDLLATSLESARHRIVGTLGDLRRLNESLESQVRQRTRELETKLADLAFLRDSAALFAQEHDPARLAPRVLELFSGRFGAQPVALVVEETDESPTKVYQQPPDQGIDWARQVAEPPSGWRVTPLRYLGRLEGRLYHRAPTSSTSTLEAFADELAAALHGAFLFQKSLAESAQRRNLLRRLLAAGEEERRRLARELHDEISQLLTVIQLSLDRVAVDEQEEEEIGRARQLIVDAQRDIHRIIFDLRPTLLDDLGLPVAVGWYADRYLASRGIDVHLEVEDDLVLPEEVEIATFRIYQEIVTNILRHSEADSVSVELYVAHGAMVLTVEDDGTGFATADQSEGSGLVGMRERADLVEGDLKIETEPGMGTTVRLVVPVPEGER